MHPRIAERRNRLAAPDPLSVAKDAFAYCRRNLHYARARVPAQFWEKHIAMMDILYTDIHQIAPHDPAALIRTQCLIDAMRALQDRAMKDLAAAQGSPGRG